MSGKLNIVFLGVLVGLASQVTAQGPSTSVPATANAGTIPLPGHEAVYDSFFRLHLSLNEFTSQRTATRVSPREKQAEQDRNDSLIAKTFHLDKAELAKLTAITNQVDSGMRALADDTRKAMNKHAAFEQRLPKALNDEFEARRLKILSDGAGRLKKDLSPQSWTGLDRYINTQHRLGIRVWQGR